MNRHFLVIILSFIVFIGTAFITIEDTINKGKGLSKQEQSFIKEDIVNKPVNTDSLLLVAKQDVENYNKSVKFKEDITNKVFEKNKELLEYEKKENELIKKLIVKFKKKTKDNKSEVKEVKADIDSICTKYKHPLFGKKKCIEYTPIYTITKDGKTIKLKEIK